VAVVCSRTEEFIPKSGGGLGMPERMLHGIQIGPNLSAKSNFSWSAK
jgi:hypothetical protein